MTGTGRLGLACLVVATALGQCLAWGQYQGPPGPVGSDFRPGPRGTTGLRRYTEQSTRVTPPAPGTIIPRDEPDRVIPYVLWNPNPVDVQVIPWGDGSQVPNSGSSLVLVGTDNRGLLHIRVFDGNGRLFADKVEPQFPPNQAGQVASLKQLLPNLAALLVQEPADAKGQLLAAVTLLVGQIPVPRPLPVVGPEGGLTLEWALERLAGANLGTRIAAEDMVQARADRVTAGLRANPQVVAGIQPVPYGSFNNNVQGGPTLYTVGVAVPLDLSGKRRNRVRGADIAVQIADATYRENVRNQIDNLYTAFIDALAAQDTRDQARAIAQTLAVTDAQRQQHLIGVIQQSQADAQRKRDLIRAIEQQPPPATLDRPLTLNRGAVTSSLAEAEDALRDKSRSLSELLGLELPPSGIIEVRGTLLDAQDEPPDVDTLIALAMEHRPDLAAQRLTVIKAKADLDLNFANRFDDWTLTFTPFTYGYGEPYGQRSGSGWGVGLNVPTPVFNRQQGQIQRACSEIRKQHLRLAQLERSVISDVRDARDKYESTWKAICSLQGRLGTLPQAFNDPVLLPPPEELRRLGTELNRLMARDYRRALNRYQTAIVEHRKSMVRINTAVGWLIVPLSPSPGSSPRVCTPAEPSTDADDD